jgi:uncharacterized protein (DUF1501 family)
MLDPDISTTGALRHLSTPEAALGASGVDDAHQLDRRRFLQLVGMGMGAGMVAGPGTSLLDTALGNGNTSWAAGPIGATDGILVVLGMFGGNDGLNTVVPITDSLYYDQHGDLAVPPAETLPINNTTGLHPELTALKEFWDQDQLAIVEGLGYPNADLSHFNSMAKWMSGKPTGIPTSGWIGRWLDGHLNGSKDLFAAAEVGHSLPLHMIGQASRATAIPASRPSFGAGDGERYARQYQTVRNLSASGTFWERQIGGAFVDQLEVAKTIAPSIPEELPEVDLVARLEVSARLINANLGFRVLTAGWGDFDSHAGQPQQHPIRMQELNTAVRRFYEVLDPAWTSRVTFMTFSEFGRTSHSNDGAGTDHGTSAPHFVFGTNVKGGMYGQRPTLGGLERWERMTHHVDFRDYYGSVIDGWLGGGASDVLGRNIENLGLFAQTPGTTAPAGPTSPPGMPVPSRLTGYSALIPHRVVDTRKGVGAEKRKIRPGETIVVKTAGTPGLPASGISSVIVNITGTESAGDTFFTTWPRGGVNPGKVSSINPSARRTCSNYVITAVNDVGEFMLFNNSSHAHAVIDIAGYCSTDGPGLLTPLAPFRMLDTRKGNGAPKRMLRGGEFIDLQVAGRGDVPASGADSVVVNITTTDATTGGWIGVHSPDLDRPKTSNGNYSPGYTIANMMTCKVGSNGKIRIYSNAGWLNMVVDVVGYYGATGSRMQAASPARILDTRHGNGAPKQKVAAGKTIDLTIRGRGGVPSNASAVIMNLTATAPTVGGYVTVFPSDVARSGTSSINMASNETLANLVISKIGADGKVKLFNRHGEVDLVADVTGWYA